LVKNCKDQIPTNLFCLGFVEFSLYQLFILVLRTDPRKIVGAAMAGGELFLEKKKQKILLLENNINHILTFHLTA
jgi:hypothetical protein